MQVTGAVLCLPDGQQRRSAAPAGRAWHGCGQGMSGTGNKWTPLNDNLTVRPPMNRLVLPQIDKSKLQAFALAKKTPFQKHKEEMEERKRVRRV